MTLPNITLELTNDEAKMLTELIIALLYGKSPVTDAHFKVAREIARKLAKVGAANEQGYARPV